MRITNQMSADIVTNDLYKNYQALLNAQITVSTGKRINKPSDDPAGMGRVLDYRKSLASIEQYRRNIDSGKLKLEETETILDEIDSLLNQVEQYAHEHASNDRSDRPLAISELKNIYDQILDLANRKTLGGHLFGGHVTDVPPFSRNADGINGTADDWVTTYNGDDGDITVLVNDNVEVKVNATGQDIFNGGIDIFASLNDLIVNMETYNQANVQAQIANIRGAVDQVQSVATESAVYYGRLETAENHLIQYENNLQDMLDKTEKVDMNQAIVQLQLQETAYTTSLEVAARIIQRSLVDFVR